MNEVVSKVLFRLILPLTLLASCIFRYNGLSLVYLMCLLLVPLISSPSRFGSSASIVLQCVVLGVSSLFIGAHLIFQIVLVSYQPYGHFLPPCSEATELAYHFGFHRYDDCNVVDVIRLLTPDVAVFFVSLITLLSSRKVPIDRSTSEYDPLSAGATPHKNKESFRFSTILPILVAVMFLVAGIMLPNVLSAVYFLTFLSFGILWAFHLCSQTNNSKIFYLKVFLTLYAAVHIVLLYMYQLVFFQDALLPHHFIPRLLGLPAIVNTTDCNKRLELHFNFDQPWPALVYPFTVFLLYWLLAVEHRFRLKKRFSNSVVEKMNSPWWHPKAWSRVSSEPLIANNSVKRQYGSVVTTEDQSTVEEVNETPHFQSTVSSFFMFLMRQIYIAALIVMMAWSIFYHSWLTFVLLLWACLTWITPFARWFCMVSSPYLVVYVDLLLIFQYIYGIELKEDELPSRIGRFSLLELGLKHSKYPVISLGVQTMFSWVFLMTLRQHKREQKTKQRRTVSSDGEMVLSTIARPLVQAFRKRLSSSKHFVRDHNIDEVDQANAHSDEAKEMIFLLKRVLSKYWILVCCAAFLLVALQNSVSLYQIFYMVIFLIGFIVYQFSLRTWKLILRPLWWFMVVYSIIILLTIYTYQFENMPAHWHNGTHLSDQWLYDLGLRQQTKTDLLVELLIPTLFSIVLVVQLHFFHKPLMSNINRILRCRKQTSGNNIGRVTPAQASTTGVSSDVTHTTTTQTLSIDSTNTPLDDENETPKTLTEKMSQFYRSLTVVLWRFAEIHMPKIVCFVVMLVVVQQVSAINAILSIFLALAMPSEYIQKLLNYIMITWSSVVVLVYMFYQLQFVNESMLDVNCTNARNVSVKNSSHFVSNAWWLGFHKSDSVSRDVRGYLFIIIVIVFQKVVKHHQELYCYRKGISTSPQPGILFPNVTRMMADESICDCLKYIFNNFFTMFGLEVNFMVMVLCMSIRADGVAVLHSLWLFFFLILRRKKTSKIWSFYIIYLSISLPIQYLMILGWPPGLCKGYPWDDWKPQQIIHWLFLTNVEKPQDQYILLVDYFQFLVACCQANVFLTESVNKKLSESLSTSGGEHSLDRYTPPDFMNNKTWLDFIKILIMDQFLWVTLTIIYVTAQNTTSLFNSGFIVGCFFFLWHGQGLYLRPKKTMRRWWKTLIAYNFIVIVAKVWLQLVSCVFIQDILKSTDCYLIQLLNLYCVRPEAYDEPSILIECETKPDSGLLLDAICFIVILMQYRIFKSSYFKYVIREHRRQSQMASRGAQLVEERLQVRLKESIQRDQRKMKLIKDKVAKLKRRLEELNPHAKEPLSHYEAIYGGDYYLFEDTDSDSDVDLKEDGLTEDGASSYVSPKETSEFRFSHEADLDDKDATDSKDKSNLPLENHEFSERSSSHSSEEMDNSISRDGLRLRKKKKSVDSHVSMEGITPVRNDSSGILLDNENDSSGILLDNESQEDTKAQSVDEKLKEIVQSISSTLESMVNATIEFLNDCSCDYRYIANQLNAERRERARTVLENNQTSSNIANKDSNSDLQSSSSSNGDKETDNDTWSIIHYNEQESWKRKNYLSVRLAVAFYYALLAHTDLLCYSLMIINHIYYASALSMPLPFFVFLWGMLSIPRPTKRFWIAIITYVELTIVVKYVFQFQLPDGKNFNECSYYDAKEAKSPLCPPRIIGIERNQYSSACDLLLLLGLFFHRFALKAHGLWREKAWSDDEDSVPGTSRESRSRTTHDSSEVTGHNNQTGHLFSDGSHEPSYHNETSGTNRMVGGKRKKNLMYNIRRFIYRMLDPEVGTGAVDVYAWMFGAQFIVFIIILSSWSAFSSTEESNSNFAKIIEENVVPKTFLYLLLTQFLLIVFDRYLYMRKQVFAKLIYLAVLLFVFHIFLFIVVPQLTQSLFTHNIPAVFLYLFQCIYFGLSAYQVRCGYPTRILGNFLTKRYTVMSGVLFQGIQAIPFLLELRSVLDWVCTKTTLTLNHWLKVEDIYANVFIIKCWRDSEKTWPHPRGMAYWSSSKWLIGGLLVVLLIVVIWFPLLFMSFVSSAYIPNRPVEVTCTLTVGGFQPLFKVTTQKQLITQLTSSQINDLLRPSLHQNEPSWNQQKAEQMIEEYKSKGNIMRIRVLSNSSAIWTISPPSRDYLIKYLETSESNISLRFKYEFTREPKTATIVQETVSGVTSVVMEKDSSIRMKLAQVLKQSKDDEEIEIPRLFPTFIQVPASRSVTHVEWLGQGTLVTGKIVLRRGSTPQMNNSQVEWWEIIQENPKPFLSDDEEGYLEIIALSDLVPPLHLSFFASKGIIGLYVGFVWLVGKFVRLFFTSISYRIMFDEMPNVDRILKLCLEIYMVRESKELKLEEDLIAKLLFLYRSPETLIKWTKYKRLK